MALINVVNNSSDSQESLDDMSTNWFTHKLGCESVRDTHLIQINNIIMALSRNMRLFFCNSVHPSIYIYIV